MRFLVINKDDLSTTSQVSFQEEFPSIKFCNFAVKGYKAAGNFIVAYHTNLDNEMNHITNLVQKQENRENQFVCRLNISCKNKDSYELKLE